MISKNKSYQNNKIDIKHNYWRIKNDLSWIVNAKNDATINENELICLYWLDINLKNTFFPWVLKLEREIKSCFIFYYKQKFKSENSSFLKDIKNFNFRGDKTKIESFIKRVNDVDNQRNLSIDGIIFDLTFGEFINIFIYFCVNDIKLNVATRFGFKSTNIFSNILKFVSILRNAIAHNKTIIKIKDEKNNKLFSLKPAFFDFQILKEEVDIISTNFSSSVYVIKKFLLSDSRKKAKKFIKGIKANLKIYKKHLKNKKIYQKVIKKIFLNYFNEIMKI